MAWFFSWYCVCVCVCVSAAALIEQTRELLFYSKPLHDLFPTWLGTREKIAQLGEHSPTIINAHLPRCFVCIQGREINITFHPSHCFFCVLCFYPMAQSAWSWGKGGGGGGNSLKGYRHFEIQPGESQQDNETGSKFLLPDWDQSKWNLGL